MKEQAEFRKKDSETNPLRKLDWKVTDERTLFEQTRHCLWAPYTGGSGQTASVAPPVGGTGYKASPCTCKQWRSQDIGDARAQHGHTTFAQNSPQSAKAFRRPGTCCQRTR